MAALIVNAGQQVSQPDWDALAAQHGGVKGQATLRAPTDAEIKAAGMGGDDDPAFQQRPIYRYYFNDGTYVEARTSANGADYQVVDYKPSSQFTQQQPRSGAASTATPSDAVPRIEGTPLPGGGFDNEQPVQVWRRPDGTVVKTEPLTPDERKQWQEDRQKSRNPGGKTDAQIAQDTKDADTRSRQAAADARAEAAANKPGPITLKPDGKGGTVAIRTLPDGSIDTKPLPGVPSDATRVTVDGVVYEKGPDGAFAPAAGIPLPGATSKNVERWQPDYTQPDLGIGRWAAAQRAKIGQPPEAGGITQAEYDQAVKAAHDEATVTIQNVTSNQTVRRQAEQDERGQRNDLSNQTAADYGRAQGVFSDILQYTKPGSRAIMDVIPGIMAEQAKFRQQREGTARPAPALHPMFDTLPAQAGVAAPSVPVQWGVTDPTMTSHGPRPISPEEAARTVGPERAAAIAANPVFRPQPMAPAPAGAEPQVGGPPVRDDYATNPGPTPINPPAGQPGHDPTAPVGMAEPGMVSAWAGPMVAPPAPMAPTGQPTLALPSVPPQPTFDPLPTAGRLAQMGLPADVIAQTMQEMGLLG